MIDRRTFVGALAGGLVVCSAAQSQPSAKPYRVGFFLSGTREQSAVLFREFIEGLRELDYVDGRNIIVETQYGDGTLNHLSDLANAVVRSRVDIIVTGSNPLAEAAKHATATIPIVMVGTREPVAFGLVANLGRPGGNITGLCVDASAETTGKNLSLLAEIVPGLSRVGLLRQVGYREPHLEAAAQRLGLELYTAEVDTLNDLSSAFAAMAAKRVGAAMIIGPLFYVRREEVAKLALKYRLPAIHALKEYAQAGLLMTYGANLAHLYRRAASYVDRLVKGAKPGDLSVEQPTKFELVINLKSANTLGLTIPQSLLLRADEVIR